MCTIRSFYKYLPALFCLLYMPVLAFAQTDSTEEASSGKAETSMELVYTKSNNRTKILTATVKTKVDESWVGAKGANVSFYQKEVLPENLLGNATSNGKGIAVLVVPEGKISNATVANTFVAAISDDNTYEDNEEPIEISEADFVMTLDEEDSVRQVMVVLQAPDADGNMTPVAETEVYLYVQRLFGLLPLSADPETTDENGEVTVEFPADLPGDTEGNLIIVARVEDHELYGNLEFKRKINWGVPLVIDPDRDNRQLWSSRANAPLYLIIIVNTMLIGIWGVILYIIYQVFQIKKLGRQSTS